MTVIGAYEAKTRLGELLDQVEAGEDRHHAARQAGRARTISEAARIAADLRCKVAASDLEIAEWLVEGRH